MIKFDILIKIVEEVSGVTSDKLISKSRLRPLVELRMICSNVLKESHKISVEKIGSILNIDHSTVSYHLRTHKNLLSQNKGNYKETYLEISDRYRQEIFLSEADKMKSELLSKKNKLQTMISSIDEIMEIFDKK